MKLILHIVTKDVRRMRGWLVVWLILLALPIALGVALTIGAQGDARWRQIESVNIGLAIVQGLMAYVSVLVLVQEDRLVGTQQFWLTRPIARWRMLAAKALGALLMVGGSALVVGLPWWLWCGFGAAEIGRAAVDHVMLAAMVIVPAMLVGAITDSLGRALLWSLAFFALVWLWSIPLMASAWTQQLPFLAQMSVVTGGALVGAAIVVVALYLTRRRARVMIAGAAAMAVWWGAAGFLPAKRMFQSEPREKNPELGADVQVQFHEAWTEGMGTRTSRAPGPAMDHVRVTFVARRPATEPFLAGLGSTQTWRWPGMDFVRNDSLSVLGAATPVSGYTLAGRTNSGANPAEEKAAEERQMQAYTLVPASYAARMASQPSKYEARLWFALVRPVVANEVPLQAGVARGGDAHRVAIHGVESKPGEVKVEMVELRPKSWSAVLASEAAGRSWFREPRGSGGYFLLNGGPKEYRHFSSVQRRVMYVHGVEVARWRAMIAPNRGRDRATEDLAAWVKHATLAYVSLRMEAVFARDVRVESFTARRVTPGTR